MIKKDWHSSFGFVRLFVAARVSYMIYRVSVRNSSLNNCILDICLLLSSAFLGTL